MRIPLKLPFLGILVFSSLLICNSVPSIYALDVSRSAIRADQVSFTGNGVVVAVIDTGIDISYLEPIWSILEGGLALCAHTNTKNSSQH